MTRTIQVAARDVADRNAAEFVLVKRVGTIPSANGALPHHGKSVTFGGDGGDITSTRSRETR
ncbi:hypothetical protein [Embleya scabrispora]|uniref:hypothetical protein n=1 Tax=Embleya scabrispora TaxID=159449 RepID=UPI00037CA5E0|nr:hypothetical protein [Embleya scabrispora]MYS86729.1 hypothetical protein [Streptomyces sp. SID5474]